MNRPEIYSCSKCGSLDVECTAWVHMNTMDIVGTGGEAPLDTVWCPGCDEHISFGSLLTRGHVEIPYGNVLRSAAILGLTFFVLAFGGIIVGAIIKGGFAAVGLR